MKKATVAIGAIIVMLSLSACGAVASTTPTAVRTVDLPDGRVLYCVVVDAGNGLAIDCIEAEESK